MRALSLTLALTCLLGVGLCAPTVTFAQDDFDDEFGDEFGDDSGGSTAPADSGGAASGGDDFGDDEFGDDFGDEDESQGAAATGGDEFGDDFGDEGGEGGEGADEEAPAGPRDAETLRSQRLNYHPTLQGIVGGVRVPDASPGAAQSFRLGLTTDFFFAGDFLNVGDQNDHIGGYLTLSWTVHELVEIYGSIISYANSNNTEIPGLFQVLGDTMLGVKMGWDLSPIFTLGGDFSIALLNTVGDIGLVFAGTSFGLRANATLDLRGLDDPFPFIGRLSLQYYFDQSAKLIEDVENARYAALPDPRPVEFEDRNLITRVERFALNINRTDFFKIGLGLEAPLEVAEEFFINPIVEWNWWIPVNRQGYDCLFIPAVPGGDTPVEGQDGCLEKSGPASFPMDLTLAVRVLPPVRGLGFMLGVDIGLTGTSIENAVRELAQNTPYNVMLGLSYAYDVMEPPPPEPVIQEVERRVEVRIPPPPKGRINGLVVEQGPGSPIAGAIVRFPGTEHSPIVTGDDGRFTSYQFDPGDIPMEITHEEYNPGSCVATLAEEETTDVEVRCELVALPRVGTVSGRVVGGEDAAAIQAAVQLTGPVSRTLNADASGSFSANDLPPGTYHVQVDAEGYLIKHQQFDIEVRETTNVQIDLVERPRNPLVRVQRSQIRIRRQINFATNSADILPTSDGLMTEIADVIIRNPNLAQIEIQGHTDNRGRPATNLDLSQRRADAVRTWLIDHGVESNRLTAQGYGQNEPLVPNITPANRARNRRVQFMIKERTEAAE